MELSLDGPLPKLCPAVAHSHQDVRHSAVALLLKELWSRWAITGSWEPLVFNEDQNRIVFSFVISSSYIINLGILDGNETTQLFMIQIDFFFIEDQVLKFARCVLHCYFI